MTRMSRYDHLNDSDPVRIDVSMDALAEAAASANYGVHRLLSAIVRNRLAVLPDDRLALGIKALLDDGAY